MLLRVVEARINQPVVRGDGEEEVLLVEDVVVRAVLLQATLDDDLAPQALGHQIQLAAVAGVAAREEIRPRICQEGERLLRQERGRPACDRSRRTTRSRHTRRRSSRGAPGAPRPPRARPSPDRSREVLWRRSGNANRRTGCGASPPCPASRSRCRPARARAGRPSSQHVLERVERGAARVRRGDGREDALVERLGAGLVGRVLRAEVVLHLDAEVEQQVGEGGGVVDRRRGDVEGDLAEVREVPGARVAELVGRDAAAFAYQLVRLALVGGRDDQGGVGCRRRRSCAGRSGAGAGGFLACQVGWTWASISSMSTMPSTAPRSFSPVKAVQPP